MRNLFFGCEHLDNIKAYNEKILDKLASKNRDEFSCLII